MEEKGNSKTESYFEQETPAVREEESLSQENQVSLPFTDLAEESEDWPFVSSEEDGAMPSTCFYSNGVDCPYAGHFFCSSPCTLCSNNPSNQEDAYFGDQQATIEGS